MRSLFLLALLGCSSACRTDCSPNATPRLDIGTGELSYVPLDADEPTYELIHGPQGGWHVIIGLDAAGLNATEIVVAEMSGSIDGEEVARNDSAWLTFGCNEETGSLQTANAFLIFSPSKFDSPCSLHDKTLEITVTLPDSKGQDLSTTIQARIDDPLHDECDE